MSFVLISALALILGNQCLTKSAISKKDNLSYLTSKMDPALQQYYKVSFHHWLNVSHLPIDLAMLSQLRKSRCLLLAINFLSVDIINLGIPVISRVATTAVLDWDLACIPKDVFCDDGTQDNIDCGYEEEPCGKLDFFHLAIRSRQWNCELQLHIFPPHEPVEYFPFQIPVY